jgi:hypothetical protein
MLPIGRPRDGQGIIGGTGFAGLTEREGMKPVIAAGEFVLTSHQM